jgi:DNA-binding NarL/FixJ family response regulator
LGGLSRENVFTKSPPELAEHQGAGQPGPLAECTPRVYIRPSMTKEQLARLLEKQAAPSPFDALSEREVELFSILAQGYSPDQIEREFRIPKREQGEIKRRILTTLGLKTDAELMRFAGKHGLGTGLP